MRSGERSIGWFQKQIERAIGAPSEARRKARSWRIAGVGLIILCLLVYIPGLWTIPPVDRDESRFAQASRQMLESGTVEGWVVPKVQDRPRLNKPPLIYWLQASSAAILGDKPGQWAWLDGGSENIWVYRVPSVFSAILTVLLTWRIGLRMFDPRAAWLAAALLAVCPMVVWDAHQARADQLLLAMTTATMGCLWCVWRQSEPNRASGRSSHVPGGSGEEGIKESRHQGIKSSRVPPSVPSWLRPSVPLFWLFLSLGIMTKGPITPLIAGLTVLALCLVSRDWSLLRRLRPLLGLVIVAIVVAPWVILVGNEVGWSKYLSIVYDETIGRSAGAKEGHWGPPGYHIVLLGVLFWPGSLLTAAAIGRAWRRGLKAKGTEAKRNTEGTEGSTEGTEKSGGGSGDVGAGCAEVRPEMHASASKGTPRSLSSLRASVASSLRGFHHSRPGRPAELFCLAWMLPAWIVFELIGTKLPHYTMPLYPAVALMSARMVLAVAGRVTKRRIDTLGSVLWVTFGFGLTIVPWILPDLLSFFHAMEREDGFQSLYLLQVIARVCALALLVGITGVVVLRQLRRDHYVRVHAFAVLLAIVSWGFMFTRLVPDFAGLSRQLSSRLKECDPASSRNLATCEYQEDSLIFLSRGRIERVPLAHLEAWAERHPGGCVIMRAEDAIRPVARGTLIEVEGKDLHTFGYNYSIGRREHLNIYEVPTK